jgi:thiol-disulfide isomerase/thioredoxin
MKTRFFQLSALCFLFASLMACASEPASESENQEPEAIPVQTVSNETADPVLPFPVYENFSELEYLFKYQNDTTYVINFWATWCKPCVAELPYFERLHAERGTEKLKVVLVSLDFAKDVETKLLKFVKQRDLQPEVIAFIDGKYNNWIDKVHPDWGGAIPVTYIYKGEKVLFHDQQYESFEELNTSVNEIHTQG